MRHCPTITSAIAGLVFAAFLAREITSLTLGFFPNQSWLWRLSFAFGYDLLPVLTTLRAGFAGGGVWATPLFLCALVVLSYAAFRGRSLFVSALVIHAATLSVWFCGSVSSGRRAISFASPELQAAAPSFSQILTWHSTLTPLAITLLTACIFSHAVFVKSIIGEGSTRRLG